VLAQVARLDARDVLDQAEEIGTGRGHRAAQIVFAQSVEFPQQAFAAVLEVVVQACPRVKHARDPPTGV
jgi:hypothetical protein